MNKIPPNDPDEAAKAKPIDPYQARRERWIRPLNGTYDRLRAWVNMIFMDHAFFRMAYLNLHSVSPKVWRAAQPLPYQIHRMARRGVKTVLTLRGGQSFGSYPLEVEACDRAGIKFEKLEFRSRALPSVAELEAAEALFANLEYPVMMHCKSGADRAGMASALYLILHEGRPVSEAREQLSIWYGHFRQGKTGILDALFDAYLADNPNDERPFMEWARTDYDPEAITTAFKSSGIGSFITERLLRRE